MDTYDSLKKYAQSVFSSAADFDKSASELARICDGVLSHACVFQNIPPDTSHQLQSRPVEAFMAAIPGQVELKLFINPLSEMNVRQSFICSVMATDIGHRRMDIEGLTLSANPEVGSYFYLEMPKGGVLSRTFTIPTGATYLRVRVQRLKVTDDKLIIEPRFQLYPVALRDMRARLAQSRSKMLGAMGKTREQRDNKPAQKFKAFLYIMDEFTESCITNTVAAYPISRNNFLDQISESNCDFVFLESFWNGNKGKWKGAMTYETPHHPQRLALDAVIQAARTKGMGLAFYNKEDPMHFDRFLPYAEKADVVFTSASEMVPEYEKALPGKPIHTLKFAAPTKMCNPAGMPSFEHRETVAFAGGYYGENHDDRVAQMDYVLPAIRVHSGAIFDRHSEQKEERYRYPFQYRRFCRKAVSYAEMVKEYRKFKVFLNVNTITQSPTMLSRRVYELLACGTPVVTAPSKAVEEQFGDTVSIVENEAAAIEETRRLIEDKTLWMQRSHLGYRHVMNGNTYDDRVRQIMQVMNPDVEQEAFNPFVSMITPTKEPGDYVRIIENALGQTHPLLELVIGFGYLYSEDDVKMFLKELRAAMRAAGKKIHLRYVHFREKVSLGYKMNALMHEATGEIIAKMDDDDYYGPNYITDMLLPMRWGNYDIIGKRGTFWHDATTGKFYFKHPNNFHRPSDFVYGATFMGRRSVFLSNPFQERSTGEDTFMLAQLKSMGYKIYAADPFNFCVSRRDTRHTWALPGGFWNNDCEELPEDMSLEKVGI
ncbi:glycosyltransferase family protein (plasmid) [Shimia sp. W99]